MTENFNILVNKLNSFKRKLYAFKLLKGIVLTLFFAVAVFTVFSIIEYYFYLSSDIRKIFFYSFLIFITLLALRFVGIPLLTLLHLLKPISLKSATQLIQKHFSEIEDKLLNIIELSEIESTVSNKIVLASIDQKIEQIKGFNFNKVVQYRNIRMVSIYLITSIVISTTIVLINKNVFTDSTHRLVNYNTSFLKPAPFTFHLKNSSLQAKKGDSFVLHVETKGEEIPKIVYINIEGNNYLMQSTNVGVFEFEMASVINAVKFYFTDLKYRSEDYDLLLLPKPGITKFKTSVFPPKYTGIQNKIFENIGDLQVPTGTRIEWTFEGIDVDTLIMQLNDSTVIPATKKGNGFIVESKFYKSNDYNIFIKNRITNPELALSYSIEIIPDLFPEIKVNQLKDSLQLTRFFFKGIIGDDYGFSSLNFHYNVNNTDSAINIPVIKNLNDQEFYYSFDFNEIENPEGTISYYFSVSDNDVINGYKTTTSDNYIFQFPDREEMLANEKEQFNLLQKKVEESQKLAREIQDDLKNLQYKNMESNTSEWEKSQMVNDIISKQNRLENLYDQIKKDNENLNNYLNSYYQQNQEIVEKQKLIEELLEEVFTDELRELMEEFKKLAQEFDDTKLNQLTENLNLTYEDLEKQLDRNLEMLVKMKVEQNLQNVIDEINRLAKEEYNLSEEILEEKNYEQVSQKTEDHKNQLDELEEQVKESLKINNDLNEPINFDDFNEEFDEINNSIENSKKELNKKNKRKSGSSLKETAEKLENLAFGMQQMLNSNMQQQNLENIENLKQILSNLMLLSFSQEDILTDLQGINAKDPMLVQLNQNQKKIEQQSTIVKDSLYALAMRTPHITSMVNNELLNLELNLKKASNEMEEAFFSNARVSQMFVITTANNLALMLNEALENLENMMANAEPGSQQCENPGQGKPGMNLMKESSENIKRQLEKMIEQMKNGQGQNLNKQLGESLIQHEMMQQMLRDIMNNGSVGSSANEKLKQIDNLLEQNRKDLMNKNINTQTIARQNLITTRLLEAEKAEMEREFENKRESESAKDFYSNPLKFFEYKENENFTIEYLQKNSHQLNNFYINKYKQFLNNIEHSGKM